MTPVITIDGPSGSGKGTISRLVAEATGFSLLDSGAIYRLTALACIQTDTDTASTSAVERLARLLVIEFSITKQGVSVLLSGQDVTQKIREENVGMTASTIAAYPNVRAALLQRQRDFRKSPGLVADGRDMGTVVFPEAPLKIFLTASAQERANRRVKQLQEAAVTDIDAAKILADIQARDERDTNRATAPLVPAEDAIILDSTSMSINDVHQVIMTQVDILGLTKQ